MTVADECDGHCFPLDDPLVLHGGDLTNPAMLTPFYSCQGGPPGGGIQAGGMDPIIGNIGP